MKLPDNVTPILNYIADFSKEIFQDNLIGIYLFGSLTYSDYIPGRSDLDFMVVIKGKPDEAMIEQIKDKYLDIATRFPDFKDRVECSFTPLSMLQGIEPPSEGRVYFGEKFYADATYGNEWIINNYLIREKGLTITGPDFKTLTPDIDIAQVQKACLSDLKTEWLPKIDNDSYLSNPHYQSYLVLNLCRILYTLKQAKAGSKSEASQWAASAYPEFKDLIEEALAWTYGEGMDRSQEVGEFMKLISKEVGLNQTQPFFNVQ